MTRSNFSVRGAVCAAALALAFAAPFPAITAAPALAQAAGNAAEPEDSVLATVNGEEIRRSDVALAYQALPQQYQQIPIAALTEPLVRQIIDRKLAAQAAEKAGVGDRPQVQQQLEFARESLFRDTWVAERIRAETTEERLKALYDEKVAGIEPQEEVRARHILLETEEAAQAAAERAKAGEDFGELAKELSTGPSGPAGGDLGYFTQDRMVKEFADAAFALQPGEVSAPVQSQFGWHVIKVEDRREAPAPTMEEMEGELRNEIAQDVIQSTLEELRADAEIVMMLPEPEKPAEEGKAGDEKAPAKQ
ncbi:MAG: peptidylprolyl isomerase [Alphaproteobacteria bacterium]|nr:peptidylprolyl isomerase [Alphaproteobacteria bacterium]MDX5370232.1 peptidylprolyl isomerase [Alphaproteobacteria bacterium]MDX5464782.1 peptidylprolyl isomerase [Alphaproteobacteria bacterium]